VTNKVCQKLSEWVDKQLCMGSSDGIDAKHVRIQIIIIVVKT